MRLKINIFSSLILTFAVLLSSFSPAFAKDEGMFTPDQIAKLPLKAKGLKISPAELYNPNGVDISDAVIRISIGCTGEFISPQGLILTNHHCGLDALVAASTPQNEFGKNGYKAASMAEELSAKDYSIFITNRVEDVTAKIRKGTENLTGDAFNAAVKTNIDNLTKEEQAKVGDANAIRIQSLNSGYYYYLYETMQIKDIRVVYAPALDIGFFGGDPDNFEWSRHTGDYTFLRAYVAPDGKSAEYSPNNVPYKPKKFLTLSLNGVKENDFVMVMGYPGGTTRYRESQAVDYAQEVNFPFLYQYLQAWSDALVKVGQEDEAKKVKNQGLVANLDNSRKLYEGGVRSMKGADIIAKKRDDETKFAAWVAANPARQAKYGEVLANLSRVSGDFYKTIARDRVLRTYPGGNTPIFNQVYNAVLSVQQGKTLSTEDKVKKLNEIQTALKDNDPVVERELIKFFLKATAELPADQKFAAAETLFSRFEGKERRAAEETFAESIAESKDFDTADKILALYSMSMNDLKKKYSNIVDYILALGVVRNDVTVRTGKFNSEIDRLRLLYQQGMAEMKKSTPYPDANSTLRFTYGNVKGYKPREAVVYTPFSTLKGVIEKDTGEFPFDVPEKLKELQAKKDFGRYGVGDSVPVNFLASTDIIGGNSGSPIMNAFGEQVGIVFDGNYEGLGNDIFYNAERGRTIAVDIRYVLFLVEKYDNMGWMLKEMTIKGGAMTKRAGA
ncbi:MAG: S46 family peptidase [Pyrinomonadaceae bacterium]